MATEAQLEAAKRNIQKAQERWKTMSHRSRLQSRGSIEALRKRMEGL